MMKLAALEHPLMLKDHKFTTSPERWLARIIIPKHKDFSIILNNIQYELIGVVEVLSDILLEGILHRNTDEFEILTIRS